MTRQQYRQAMRDIEKLKQQYPQAMELMETMAVKAAVCTSHALYAITLNTLHGFGTERINKLIDRVMNQFDCMKDGHLEGADIKQWCKDNDIQYERCEVE